MPRAPVQSTTVEEAVHGEEPASDESLRERKKRRFRQRISHVATSLLLAEGFDHVSVARIAAAREVSEQTVLNYYPTKGSMFIDRVGFADAFADALRRRRDASISGVVMDALFGGVPRDRWSGIDGGLLLRLFRHFCEVAEGSPALRAAPYAELESFTATVGTALAERVGVDPDCPEPLRHGATRGSPEPAGGRVCADSWTSTTGPTRSRPRSLAARAADAGR